MTPLIEFWKIKVSANESSVLITTIKMAVQLRVNWPNKGKIFYITESILNIIVS